MFNEALWLFSKLFFKQKSNKQFPQKCRTPMFRFFLPWEDMSLKPGPNICSEICAIPGDGAPAPPVLGPAPVLSVSHQRSWRRKRSGSSPVVETSTGPVQGGMDVLKKMAGNHFGNFFTCMMKWLFCTILKGFTRKLKHILALDIQIFATHLELYFQTQFLPKNIFYISKFHQISS